MPEEPQSPPIAPKGSYNIDFDSIDFENFNPFETKSKVSNNGEALPAQNSVSDTAVSVKKDTPAKASPKKPVKKATPKKPTPKKQPTPKKASPVKAEEADDSFHDAVEEVVKSPQKVFKVYIIV